MKATDLRTLAFAAAAFIGLLLAASEPLDASAAVTSTEIIVKLAGIALMFVAGRKLQKA